MGDPGWIALLIFVGTPVGGLVGVGAWRLRAALARRHLAKLRRTAKWTAVKFANNAGGYDIVLHQWAEGHIFAREVEKSLPAGTDQLEVDVALWEAGQRAVERNG